MAGSMKKVMLIGNVGQDPSTKFLPDGAAVCSFTLAVNDRPKKNQPQGEEQTTWFRISAWRRQAEVIQQYVTKGTSLFVLGNLTAREYKGNDGQTRTSLDVDVEEFQILTPKGEGRPQFGQQDTTPFDESDQVPF